nr:ABC transporter permease [Streptococcus panodentis]
MSKKTQKIAVPLISVLLGILLGALVMWAFGYDAIWGYESLFKTAFGSLRSFGEISRAMGPLILIALGFAVASRAGFFNVGLPGQALAGWILAGWFALLYQDKARDIFAWISWPIALFVAIYVGRKFFLYSKAKDKKEKGDSKLYGLSAIAAVLSFAVVAALLQVCISFLPERFLVIFATVLIGLAAGGIVGAIPGILRAYLGTSEVIVTIMMNYIVLFVGNAIIHDAFPKSVMQSVDSSKRVGANAIYQTDWLRSLTSNSRMNIGIFFALIAVVIIWYLLKKTTLGFEIRSVGLNPHASEYAGMSAKRTIILSMIISGALAGLGGVVEGLGTYQNVFVQGGSLSVGFNGMAVSLLAANSPIGILFAAFLFAVLSVGAPGMNVAQIPTELVNIVTASIIFFVSAHYIIERLTGKTVFEWFQNSRKTNKTVKGEN